MVDFCCGRFGGMAEGMANFFPKRGVRDFFHNMHGRFCLY